MSDLSLSHDSNEIPQDLKDQIGAVQGLATTYNLLDRSLFNNRELTIVKQCMAFINKLYEEARDIALLHPDSDQSKLLKQLREELATIEKADKIGGSHESK